MHADRPRLLAIPMPSGDRLFARHLRVVLDRNKPATPKELQDRLRSFYPDAQVHPRELSGETHPTWYVYREARLSGLPTGWWEGPETGALTVDGSDNVESANASASSHLGVRHDDLIGRPLRDFFPARARADADQMLDIVRDVGFGETRWNLARSRDEEVLCGVRAAIGLAGLELRFAPVEVAKGGPAHPRRSLDARGRATEAARTH